MAQYVVRSFLLYQYNAIYSSDDYIQVKYTKRGLRYPSFQSSLGLSSYFNVLLFELLHVTALLSFLSH
jgi:hypothetical protein